MFSAAVCRYLHKPLNQNAMTRNSKIFAEQFVPFLVAHHAFGRYVSNYTASFPRLLLDRFIDTSSVGFWISFAFDFEDTPEGYGFWLRLHEEWHSIARHF